MKKAFLFSVFIALVVWSCNDKTNTNDEITPEIIPTVSVSGYVQKGPFINGTSITINELKSDLTQTGKNYSAQILDNKGTFEINNVSFESPYVELKADGFYFNEVSNETSSAQLTLYALSDISNDSTLNVNVLSYLEKGRMQYLIANGLDFASAKTQAQREILSIFSIDLSDISTSEHLNIADEGEGNAALLAVSVILQGYLSVAELSELLANISTDIREDGKLDSETLGLQLTNTAKRLQLADIRNNIEARYAALGSTVQVADFEKYVTNFIANSGFEPTEKIEYPVTGNYGPNILSSENINFPEGNYSMTAILPYGYTLKVKISGDSWYFPSFQENTGWEFSEYNESDKSRIFTSTRTGEIEYNFELKLYENSSPIHVSVYENEASEPTWTRTLTWGNGSGFDIPTTGSFGPNIFAITTDSTHLSTAQTYSLAINLPDDKTYDVEIKLHFTQENTYVLDTTNIINWTYYKSPLELRLVLQGRNINADVPITFVGSDFLSIEGGVRIDGINW